MLERVRSCNLLQFLSAFSIFDATRVKFRSFNLAPTFVLAESRRIKPYASRGQCIQLNARAVREPTQQSHGRHASIAIVPLYLGRGKSCF